MMKVAFLLPKEGLKAGPKFDSLMRRVSFMVLTGNDVSIIHEDDKIRGSERGVKVDQFFFDEAQNVKG